jgi:hypothetical protein
MTSTYLSRGSGQEVVHLLVDVDGASKVLNTANLGLDKVVAVNGGRDSRGVHAGGHELQERHLSSGILARDSLWNCQYVESCSLYKGAYVRAELEVARPASDVLVFGVVEVAVENFLREGQGPVETARESVRAIRHIA